MFIWLWPKHCFGKDIDAFLLIFTSMRWLWKLFFSVFLSIIILNKRRNQSVNFFEYSRAISLLPGPYYCVVDDLRQRFLIYADLICQYIILPLLIVYRVQSLFWLVMQTAIGPLSRMITDLLHASNRHTRFCRGLNLNDCVQESISHDRYPENRLPRRQQYHYYSWALDKPFINGLALSGSTQSRNQPSVDFKLSAIKPSTGREGMQGMTIPVGMPAITNSL